MSFKSLAVGQYKSLRDSMEPLQSFAVAELFSAHF
jgi:hypothetical protein